MISVCMATYNGERFIKRQLETISEQLGDGDEIVISDDGSTDGTLDVVRSMNSPLIHIYINEGEHGYTPNFEHALRHARGEYIFLSDQDDVWLPGKVDVCMKVLASCDFVVSDAVIVDAEERILFPSFFDKRLHFKSFWGNMMTIGYIGCCMAFRASVLKRVLPFPLNYRFCTHDNWILLVALLFYRTKVLDERLVGYRRHGKNVSIGHDRMEYSMWFRIRYRLYLLIHLCGRAFLK